MAYATLNPSDKASIVTLSGGDLVATVSNNDATGGYYYLARATLGKASGKWYWEQTVYGISSGTTVRYSTAALIKSGFSLVSSSTSDYPGSTADAVGGPYHMSDVKTYINAVGSSALGAATSPAGGSLVIRHKLDMDTGTYEQARNGGSFFTVATGLTGIYFPAFVYRKGTGSVPAGTVDSTFNFGASAFTYSVPSGYNSGVYSDGISPSVTETGVAPAITPAKAVSLGAASESGVASSLTGAHVAALGVATETGVAPSISQWLPSFGPASETGVMPAITPVKLVSLGVVTESGAIVAVTPAKGVSLGAVAETGTAPTIYENPFTAYLSVASPLGAPQLVVFHDWSAAIPAGATYTYLFTVGDDPITLPIRSWQATLRADVSSYVQCVIPNVGESVDAITARLTEDFVITRRATLRDGSYVTQEMARAPAQTLRLDRGATNYTATLSGYAVQFYTPAFEVVATTRTLPGVKSITAGSETRVRCDLDWFLRPGQLAVAGGNTFTVTYINYYVNDTRSFMDVGGVAA